LECDTVLLGVDRRLGLVPFELQRWHSAASVLLSYATWGLPGPG
jgi:hypothetical protein